MIASERKLYILRRLNEQGVINLKEVAVALGISETTVRRDFEKLEKEGKLNRVQGGAMLNDEALEVLDNVQSSMSGKKNLHRDAKRTVARRAAELVRDGESIFLDCGTSIEPLGEMLLKRRVHIVTNNTLLLNHSAVEANMLVLGGQYRPHHNMLCGPLTKQMVEGFHFDHAFIGCFGVSLEQGKAYTLEVDSAEIKLAGMAGADRCHLLIDHSKFERNGFYGFAELDRFATVFCDKLDTGPVPANFVLTGE